MSNQMNDLPFRKIGIDGFRGLRQLRLERLGRINLLVGANNSGKTSVLEALSLICQPENPEECLEMIRRRDFGGLDETRLHSLRWCFRQEDQPFEVELPQSECTFDIKGNFPLQTLKIRYREFFGEASDDDYLKKRQYLSRTLHEGVQRGGELSYFPGWHPLSADSTQDYTVPAAVRVWERMNPLLFRHSPKKGKRLRSETLTPYAYQINRIQVKSLSDQKLLNGALDVTNLLREFDADVLKVEVASTIGERPAIYIQHKKLGWAPLSVFGDAMRRSLLLASILPRLRGGVLLIDEIEVGIHISALQRVFKWLHDAARSLGIQIFVTTHSLEALDAMLAVCSDTADEEVVAFHLQQGEQQTECKRFAGPLLNRLRFERGLDVRL